MSITQVTHCIPTLTSTDSTETACDVADDVRPAPFAPIAAARHIASGVAA